MGWRSARTTCCRGICSISTAEPLVYRTGQSVPDLPVEGFGGNRDGLRARPARRKSGRRGPGRCSPRIRSPIATAADGTFAFPGTSIGTHALTASLFVGDEMTGELLSKTVDITVAADPNDCVDILLERPSTRLPRVLFDGSAHVFDEGERGQGHRRRHRAARRSQPAAGEPHADADLCGRRVARRGEGHRHLRRATAPCASTSTRSCSRGAASCAAPATTTTTTAARRPRSSCATPRRARPTAPRWRWQNGLTASAVNEFTLLNFRVDNEEEHTGEFGRSTIKVTQPRGSDAAGAHLINQRRTRGPSP